MVRNYAGVGTKDRNHAEIAAAFERMGASVFDASGVGDGFSDIVVGFAGQNVLVEIKDPLKAPSKRKLNAKQIKFKTEWRGWYEIAETIEDVLRICNVMRLNQINTKKVLTAPKR